MVRGRNLKKEVKEAKIKRALELKEKYPYLTWKVIAIRVGVYDSSILGKMIREYKNGKDK